MPIILGVLFLVMWLTVGILAERSMNDLTGGRELSHMVLPLRIAPILLAPILFLIFERQLFYRSRSRLTVFDDIDAKD